MFNDLFKRIALAGVQPMGVFFFAQINVSSYWDSNDLLALHLCFFSSRPPRSAIDKLLNESSWKVGKMFHRSPTRKTWRSSVPPSVQFFGCLHVLPSAAFSEAPAVGLQVEYLFR